MSLRLFHSLFVLIAIVTADMFGIWAVRRYADTHEISLLVFGVLSFLIGFGLIAYAIWFVRKLDQSPGEPK